MLLRYAVPCCCRIRVNFSNCANWLSDSNWAQRLGLAQADKRLDGHCIELGFNYFEQPFELHGALTVVDRLIIAA